ncbi:MAG TPA: DMT family transporter [Anaeromyxobacteraceae bacterium]
MSGQRAPAPGPAPHHRHLPVHPALLLALAQLLWAGNFVLGRAVSARVPPVALAFWRWAVALLILVPLAWRELKAAWPVLRRALPILVALGILGVGNFNTMVYVGLGQTSATSAALLNSACPAFILALGPLLGGPRPRGRQAAGIAVSLLGVLTIVARGSPATLLGLSFSRGDAWVLGAVLSWAAYTVLLGRRPAGVHPLALLTVLVAIGLAWIAPFYALEAWRGARLTLDAPTLGSLAYVGVMASVVAYAAWNQGVAELGAQRSGAFLHLLPAFATILAVLLLGEAFRAYHAAGIALVLLGVRVASRPAAAAPPPPPAD